MRQTAAFVLACLASACAATGHDEEPGREIVLALDRARVAALGLGPDAGVEDARDLVARRLAAAGVDATVEARDGGLCVTTATELPRAELDAIARRLGQIGQFEILVMAEKDAPGMDAERERLEAWRALHPDEPLARYDLDPERSDLAPERSDLAPERSDLAPERSDLAPERSDLEPERSDLEPERRGARVAWMPAHWQNVEHPEPVELPASLAVAFGGADVARAYVTSDRYGYPALGVELVPERVEAFRAFTEAHRRRQVAMVFEGAIRSAPQIESPLAGNFIIEGRFTDAEIEHLVALLRGPNGPLEPR